MSSCHALAVLLRAFFVSILMSSHTLWLVGRDCARLARWLSGGHTWYEALYCCILLIDLILNIEDMIDHRRRTMGHGRLMAVTASYTPLQCTCTRR